MVKITEFIRIGFTTKLLEDVQAEARFQRVGVNLLVRTALEEYLRRLDNRRIDEAYEKDIPVKTRKVQTA